MSKAAIPPVLEMFSRQIAIGLGKIASKAIVSAGKSVTGDIAKAGVEIQRRANRTMQKLDKLIPPDDED
jgi:hypothetical protein